MIASVIVTAAAILIVRNATVRYVESCQRVAEVVEGPVVDQLRRERVDVPKGGDEQRAERRDVDEGEREYRRRDEREAL